MHKLALLILCLIATYSQDFPYEMLASCSEPSDCGSEFDHYCNGKCITFTIQDGEVLEKHLQVNECWNLNSCDGFPRLYIFQIADLCRSKCGVKQHEVVTDDYAFYWDICLEEASEDSPFPNVCELWEALGDGHLSSLAFMAVLIIYTILY